jgi:hypothetical protein
MNSPDPLPDRSDFYRNPLWEVVLAMACLATILLCLVAS